MQNQYYKKIQPFFFSIIYFIGFLVSIYSMALSPQFPDRAWSGPIILGIIGLGNIVSKAPESDFINRLKTGCLLFSLVVVISFYITRLS